LRISCGSAQATPVNTAGCLKHFLQRVSRSTISLPSNMAERRPSQTWLSLAWPTTIIKVRTWRALIPEPASEYGYSIRDVRSGPAIFAGKVLSSSAARPLVERPSRFWLLICPIGWRSAPHLSRKECSRPAHPKPRISSWPRGAPSGRSASEYSGGGPEPLPPPYSHRFAASVPLRSRFLGQRRGVPDLHRAVRPSAGQALTVRAEGHAPVRSRAPLKARSSRPVSASHTFTVPSQSALARRLPSGL
jgi:hypothetical protein